jgi:hypothetical protein
MLITRVVAELRNSPQSTAGLLVAIALLAVALAVALAVIAYQFVARRRRARNLVDGSRTFESARASEASAALPVSEAAPVGVGIYEQLPLPGQPVYGDSSLPLRLTPEEDELAEKQVPKRSDVYIAASEQMSE